MSSLLEKKALPLRKYLILKMPRFLRLVRHSFFFFVDSKEEFIELKEVDKSKFKNLNFIVFKKRVTN